jgi:hypothetical protein
MEPLELESAPELGKLVLDSFVGRILEKLADFFSFPGMATQQLADQATAGVTQQVEPGAGGEFIHEL